MASMAPATKTLEIVGSVLCEHCAGACCRYVALPIDKPRTLRDYDDIRWYVMHEGFSVFVEDGDWYVQVQARCKNLQADNLCRIYETRPRICREYQGGDCDYGGGEYNYDLVFNFVLHDPLHPFQEAPLSPLGIADYCVAIIGNERIETEPDMRGHFSFSHRFTDVRTGQTVLVEAAAYRLKGRRDYMRIAGQWVRGSSPYDKPDKRVAADSVRLQFYEAPIEIVLEPSGDDWLIEAGRLDIRRLDGTVSTVLPDRLDRRGFTMSGPDTAGRYRVKYVPSGTELNPTGSTQAVFIISDRSGKTHRLEETILTP